MYTPKVYDGIRYNLPERNILVLSCIDLRLTDDVLGFLNAENMQNRFDQLVLAGASLGYGELPQYPRNEKGKQILEGWRKVIDDHVNIAVNLHDIHDVFIIEHQNCRAYDNFLGVAFTNEEDARKAHLEIATGMAKSLQEVTFTRPLIDATTTAATPIGSYNYIEYNLGVHIFYMDLRGNVSCLASFPEKKSMKRFEA